MIQNSPDSKQGPAHLQGRPEAKRQETGGLRGPAVQGNLCLGGPDNPEGRCVCFL